MMHIFLVYLVKMMHFKIGKLRFVIDSVSVVVIPFLSTAETVPPA